MHTHHGGVPWDRAKLPDRRHTCVPWSQYDRGPQILQRCPCGGARMIARFSTGLATPKWRGVNARRRDPALNLARYRRPWWVRVLRKVLP